MNWVWVILWSVVGWLSGVLLFFIGGFAVHISNNPKHINGVANHYSSIAMKLLDGAGLFERGTKYDIYRRSHDAEKNADTYNMDGETVHVTNETGLLSTLHKRPFGLVPPPEEDVAVYVSPEVAELGEKEAERKEQGELTDENDDYQDTVHLNEKRPLVQLREYAKRMVPGDRSLYDLDETVELYKQSQSMFGESKNTQFMILITAYGAAMVVTWLIVTQAGGSVPEGAIPSPTLFMGGF